MRPDIKTQKRLFSVFIYKYCYEILLISLLFQLYGSVFFTDLHFYETYFRVINVLFFYLAATNSFFHRKKSISVLFASIIGFTLCCTIGLLNQTTHIMLEYLREIAYLAFLLITIYYTSSFLFSPHRIDKALISAAIAGYLLLIEIAVRIFMILFLAQNHGVLSPLDLSQHTSTYIDIVYYCTITATSIGFGDILPISHNAKMVTSILGLSGQFYLVIIMSIMISKFNSKKHP
jgi:hypothetical protein